MKTDDFPDSPFKGELESPSAFRIASLTQRGSFVLKVEFCIHYNGPHRRCLLEASQARFPKLDK